MCDWAFCEALSTIQYENLSFPTANALVLHLNKASDDVASTTSVFTKEKVVNFARTLLQLTPAASSVSLRLFVANEDKPSYKQFYGALVSALYHDRTIVLDVRNRPDQVTPTLVSGVPLTLSLQDVSGLTSITHGLEISCAHFAHLAYLNDSTLKTPELIYGGTDMTM